MKTIDPKTVKKILVVALGGIGNLILLIPAMKALRDAFPGRPIILWTAESHVDDIIRSEGLVDGVLLQDAGARKNVWAALAFIRKIHNEKFDMVFVSSGTNAFKTGLLTWLMGIPHRVGENVGGMGFWYTVKIDYVRNQHELDGALKLVEAIGVKPLTRLPFLKLSEQDRDFADRFLSEQGIAAGDRLVGMHVGVGTKWAEFRKWPLERFTEVARRLMETCGAKILLTGGVRETALVRQVAAALPHPAVITAGKMDLCQTAAVIRRCHLFISNDSGLAHIAAAVGTPLIVLFGPTNEKITGPRGHNVRIFKKGVSDGAWERPRNATLDFMNRITVDEVFAAAQEMLTPKAAA